MAMKPLFTKEEMKELIQLKFQEFKDKTTPWNVQDHLTTKEDVIEYLNAAMEENDREYFLIALADAAHAVLTNKDMFAEKQEEITAEQLRAEMRRPEYWRDQDPDLVKKIENGFKKLYGEKQGE